MMVSTAQKNVPKSPDGGWGWVVVFASFMIHIIADGVTYTFGIFYVELLKYFGTSKATTAWVASIMTGTTYCVGPIASGLTNKYGCRLVTIIGSLFASTGLIISIFAPNIVWLYFTIGICTGFGFGLMYLPAIVSVTCYFEKRRAFATGIAVCGSGLGSALLAPIIEWLIQDYGWKGAMLIIAGLVLNCCVFGALFRPLESSPEDDDETDSKFFKSFEQNGISLSMNKSTPAIKITVSEPELESFSVENNSLDNSIEMKSSSRHSSSLNQVNEIDTLEFGVVNESISFHSIQPSSNESDKFQPSPNFGDRRRSFSLSPGILTRKDIFYSGSVLNIPQFRSNPILFNLPKKPTGLAKPRKSNFLLKLCNCSDEVLDTFTEMMDFRLLKNAVFLIFAISNFLTSIGFFVPHIYMKDRIVGLEIGTDEEASWLLSIIGISSTVGRLVFGFISDHEFINRLWLYNVSLTLCGLVTVMSSLGKTYWYMALYCTLFGLSCGTYVSLTSVILVDLLGIEKLTNAFGILLLFQGVASFIGPPIIGWLYDMTGTYDTGFYVAGSMIAVSGFMLFVIIFAKYCKSIQRSLIL